MYWKCLNPNRNGIRHDEMALKTTCIKNIIFKIIKIKIVCQYIGNFYYCKNLKWAAQNLQLGRGLGIAALNPCLVINGLQRLINILIYDCPWLHGDLLLQQPKITQGTLASFVRFLVFRTLFFQLQNWSTINPP